MFDDAFGTVWLMENGHFVGCLDSHISILTCHVVNSIILETILLCVGRVCVIRAVFRRRCCCLRRILIYSFVCDFANAMGTI